MKKRLLKNTDKSISLLGLGCMRFPTLPDGEIDEAKAQEIVDYAYKNGVNYFDTAYMYHGGKSEVFIGKALKKYDRNSYYLTDKLPIWEANTPDDMEKIFNTQLERCGVDRFDFYLCHSLQKSHFDKIVEFKAFEFLQEKKKEGKIAHIGFSFHDTPEVLEEILKKYPWEFCQLQLNYFDWDFQDAKKQYELCEKYNVQVIVMEPVRGGSLANLGDAANSVLKQYSPEKSVASWAVRFAMEKENVLTVLSGMTTLEQVVDNINTVCGEITLSKEENDVLLKALDEYKKSKQIPCTGCNYCDGCPAGIDIRSMFKLVNSFAFNKNRSDFKKQYEKIENKANACISCGKCASHCPQSINIPEEMKKIAEMV